MSTAPPATEFMGAAGLRLGPHLRRFGRARLGHAGKDLDAPDQGAHGPGAGRRLPVDPSSASSSAGGGQLTNLGQYDLDHAVAIALRRHGRASAEEYSRWRPRRLPRQGNGDAHVHIFNGAGVECARGTFPLKGELVQDDSAVFWTEQDRLCCMLKDGALLSYNVHGIGPLVARVLPELAATPSRWCGQYEIGRSYGR